jgi:hypothetical protein
MWYSFPPNMYLSRMPTPKKSSHYITHAAMHYPEDDNSQVEFFNFPQILHMFKNHTNK